MTCALHRHAPRPVETPRVALRRLSRDVAGLARWLVERATSPKAIPWKAPK